MDVHLLAGVKSLSADLLAAGLFYDRLVTVLDEMQSNILLLQDQQNVLTDRLKALQASYDSLSARYSELLYKFSEVRNASK